MFCFDQNDLGDLVTTICHHGQGNQYFRYDIETKQIFHGSSSRDECIEMDLVKFDVDAVYLAKCDENLQNQKWNWAFINETALQDWGKYGTEIADPVERKLFTESET